MNNLLAILWTIMLGSTVATWNLNADVQVELKNTPLYEGTASWYDYTLNINWQNKEWSKTHDTCALRIYERYQTFRVCSKITGKCVDCYHNDYGPAREDRIIDLSSHAFKELGIPLSRWLTPVEIYIVW